MKQHLETIAACTVRIEQAQAKLARIDDEEQKHVPARDAAVHQASDLRAKANHAGALALIGEGTDAEAKQLDEQAEAAEKRAGKIAAVLDGMPAIRAEAQAAIESALAERRAAAIAELDTHAEAVVADYTVKAQTFIDAFRRVRAVEQIRHTLGDARALLKGGGGRDCVIPAPVAHDGRHFGTYGDRMFSAEHERGIDGAQREATDREIETLAKAGLEI